MSSHTRLPHSDFVLFSFSRHQEEKSYFVFYEAGGLGFHDLGDKALPFSVREKLLFVKDKANHFLCIGILCPGNIF